MPNDARTKIMGNVLEAVKHQTGVHDQSSHGNWSDGRMAERTVNKGGFTYQPNYHKRPTSGYALSIFPEHEYKFKADGLTTASIKSEVAKYREAKKDLLADPEMHLGAWYNHDDGHIYLDLSIVKQDAAEAEQLARSKGQLAMFNLNKLEEVRFDGK